MSRLAKWYATFRKIPYVQIISEGGDSGEGFELKLDWNDYFISDLAKAGIEGEDEDEMVRVWLQRIMRATDYEKYQEDLMLAAEEAEREKRGVI